MIHVAGPTTIFWTVAMGMGFTVLAVVVVLLNLLLKSARALDARVDHVWTAALGVHAHTAVAGPQLNAAEQQLASAVAVLRGPAPRPAASRPGAPQFGVPGPQFRPAPAPPAPAQPTAPIAVPHPSQSQPAIPTFPRDTGPQRRPEDPRFPTTLPPVPPAPKWEPGTNPRRPR